MSNFKKKINVYTLKSYIFLFLIKYILKSKNLKKKL